MRTVQGHKLRAKSYARWKRHFQQRERHERQHRRNKYSNRAIAERMKEWSFVEIQDHKKRRLSGGSRGPVDRRGIQTADDETTCQTTDGGLLAVAPCTFRTHSVTASYSMPQARFSRYHVQNAYVMLTNSSYEQFNKNKKKTKKIRRKTKSRSNYHQTDHMKKIHPFALYCHA